jgi:hypothetical protein
MGRSRRTLSCRIGGSSRCRFGRVAASRSCHIQRQVKPCWTGSNDGSRGLSLCIENERRGRSCNLELRILATVIVDIMAVEQPELNSRRPAE